MTNPARVPLLVLAVAAAAITIVACGGKRAAKSRDVPTPASSTVSTDEQARQDAASLDQMLAGRISGVTVKAAPGGGIIVKIGGPTSFYSREDPLFVVDDVPIEPGPNGTLSWLNPHDIASITVLKDPSTTAIYGVRGANGVIVIKTKGSH
jgi:iron complex outermembrane receptor protein